MPTGELIEIYGAILATLGILFASIKYLITSRIAPIEAGHEHLKEEQDKLEAEVEELKKVLLDEIKTISEANYEFRIKYESGINEIRLLLAEKYVSKADLGRAIDEMHKKIDSQADMSQILKTIMESLKELNS